MAAAAAYNHGSCVMLFMLLVASLCGIVTALGGDQEGRRHISREEHFQVKNKLRFLNRPSVKSIQTENGDIFDCVNIHKQPAFDHPLLKDHTIQLRPNFVPSQVKSTSDESSANSYTTLNTGLLDGGCPDGTVPIRRVHRQDILKANSISDFGQKFVSGDHHYAIKSGEGKFYGIKGNMNLWKPAVRHDAQFSLSQFWLSNINGILNTIEAGWHVDPAIYNGDRTPRLFVYWTADNYQSTGCYNLLCSGFVQVSQSIPVGLALNRTSIYMKEQYELELTAFRDPDSGNWWLTCGSEHEFVGYWPSSLFTNLNEGATRVTWGGEIYVTKDDLSDHYPEMGSGKYASEGYQKSCYTRKLQVSGDDPNSIVFKDFENANTVMVDTPKCYNMTDAQDPDFKPGFFFGGPGVC